MTNKEIESDVTIIAFEMGVSHFADNGGFREALTRLLIDALINLKRIADAVEKK